MTNKPAARNEKAVFLKIQGPVDANAAIFLTKPEHERLYPLLACASHTLKPVGHQFHCRNETI